MRKTLKSIRIRKKYINAISKGLEAYFEEFIFKPIQDILRDEKVAVLNDKQALLEAINSGRVYYEKGAFRTKTNYSNAIATELEELGAKYRNGAYFIAESELPLQYQSAINLLKVQQVAKLTAVSNFLFNYGQNLNKFKVEDFIKPIVERAFLTLQTDILISAQKKEIPVIELGFVNPKKDLAEEDEKKLNEYWAELDRKEKELKERLKRLKKAKEKRKKEQANNPKDDNPKDDVDLSNEINNLEQELTDLRENQYKNAPKVNIDLSELDKESKKIAEDYTYNMQYWVKGWEEKNIVKMRQDVLEMVRKGVRQEQITKYFEDRWKIAKNKAKFLAENESGLASSVIFATRSQQMGCKYFEWLPSNSKEKRKLHEFYYHKIFSFDNPPIIDEKLGIKGLPQQIWNCKCYFASIYNPNLYKDRKTLISNVQKLYRKYLTTKASIKNSTQRKNYACRYRRFGEG